jgi:hypothetical protein
MRKKLLMHICVLAALIYKKQPNLESQMFLDFGKVFSVICNWNSAFINSFWF